MEIEEAIAFFNEMIEEDNNAAEAKLLLELIEESEQGSRSVIIDVGDADGMLIFEMANTLFADKGRAGLADGRWLSYRSNWPLSPQSN